MSGPFVRRKGGPREHDRRHPDRDSVVPDRDFQRRRSTTCAGASRRRAGPPGSSSQTVRRACSWRRSGRSRTTGRTSTTSAGSRRRLNALPQFTTEIDGVEIHFIHVRSRHENALPLIMTHGWPGSVIELLDTVGPLTDPTAFGGTPTTHSTWCCRPCPATASPSEPAELGWDAARTGRAWAELMHRLGYTRYVAQGGDVGALVTDLMGRQAVEGLVGYHLNLLTAVLAIGDHLPRESDRNAPRPRRSRRSSRTASATSSRWRRDRRRSATPCWIHPSPWRPGCSTTTRTATTRSPARSSTASPSATSPGTPSSTTSPCTG